MRIGIMGTGVVARTLGGALIRGGHEVMLGSRTAGNARAAEWARESGATACHATFADAAAFGEVLFNCTSGTGSLSALEAAGEERLAGRILIDVANPLDFSRGMPPTLTVCNTDSLAEQIQRRFPATRVVKALNTVTARVMVEPGLVPGEHDLFICGNDDVAKASVAQWLSEWFGWPAGRIIDVGDITCARGTEMLLPLWVRLYAAFGTPVFNFHIARS